MLAALVLSVLLTVSSPASISAAASGFLVEPDADLQRGGFFGAKLEPVADEVREQFKLEAGQGVTIGEVIASSTAEGAGFKAGDVLLALNGAKIAGPGSFVQAIAGQKAGAELTIELRRGEDVRTEKVRLKARPFERSDAYEVVGHPGRGTFLAMDGIDHGFDRAGSRRASFERGRSRRPAEFNPGILDICRAWIEKTAAQPAGQVKDAG